MSGYDCAGCGSQRAIHYLLNFQFIDAVKENILLVVSIPYILLGWYFDSQKSLAPNAMYIRRTFYGVRAAWIILGIIAVFALVRNLF